MPDEMPENPDEVEGLNEAAESREPPPSPAHVESERPTRTPWKRIALVAGGGAAAVGIAMAWSKAGLSLPVTKNVSVPSHAATAVRRPLDHQVPVRQHVRRQPYGPNRSLSKEIIVHEHVRGPKAEVSHGF
jgi:hypothetical protein